MTTVNGTCTSASSSPMAINVQPATPAVPTLVLAGQPNCTTAIPSSTISNSDSNATYTFSPPTGATRNGATVTATAGRYTMSAVNGTCTSASSSPIAINVQPATPAVPTLVLVSQPNCTTATRSFTINNYDSNT